MGWFNHQPVTFPQHFLNHLHSGLTMLLPSWASGIRRFKASSNLGFASGCETVRLPIGRSHTTNFPPKWWWKVWDIPGYFRQSEGWWNMIIWPESMFFSGQKNIPTPATNLGFVYCLGWFFFSSHCIPWDSSPFSMQQQENKVQGPRSWGRACNFLNPYMYCLDLLVWCEGGGEMFQKNLPISPGPRMAILELERLGPTSPAAPSAASAPAPVPGLEVAARAKPAEETSNLERWFHGWSTYVPPRSPKVSGI